MGMYMIFCSLPFSLFFYKGVYGVPYFSELHSLVLFIVLGVGADDVFVLVDSCNSDDVYKSTYLCTKYSYHESIVDSFVILLLQRLGFYDGWLYPFPQLSLPLRYSAATADFAIMHVLSFYCMAVVKDKCVNNDMVNSEPQLIAEAIAMSQANDAARIGYWMCA